MTDDNFIDIESAQGQAALIAQTRQAIDNIGAVAATSPDNLVRVRVTASGSIVDIDLDEGTRRLDCDELGRLITATAHKAAQNAQAKVFEAFAELEQRRERMLEQLSEVDPEIAAALRDVAANTRPKTAPAGDPFGLLRQPSRGSARHDHW